ncbi:MAG: MFS transporter [Opitutaceae bacterium]|jgi:FSR family fosmidomycin resistance protein-like MFS transporter
MDSTAASPASPHADSERTVVKVLVALSISHLLNDTMQSLIPAIYPLLKAAYGLNFAQIGLITFTFQCTASLLQPLVGFYTDRRPQPFSLAAGMGFTLAGLALLSRQGSYSMILVSAGLVGVGSSIFHPEASRLAKVAAGRRHGFAQSLFQVGGNLGSSIGPLLAAAVVVPGGQRKILWFTLLALAGIALLTKIGGWYRERLESGRTGSRAGPHQEAAGLSRRRAALSIAVLLVLVFSKYFYLVSITSYYTFYLIHKFHVSVQSSQIYLFVFLFAVAAGTFAGGPLGDRFGRKPVIWVSILGVAPFTLILPQMNLFWTILLTVPIGLILASAFSVIIVYAQEIVPGRPGMIAGLFYGFSFGMAGIGSALLGVLADHTSIFFVYKVCAYLPLIGLLTGFLPNLKTAAQRAAERRSLHP